MEDFPRGGSSSLTPLEVRKVKQDAAKDVLFGDISKSTKRKKSKSQKTANSSKGDQELFMEESRIKSVQSLTYKKLSEGMLVLGCVREIQMTELVVSLANSLNGYIPITYINDQVNKTLEESVKESDEEDDESGEATGQLDLHNLFSIGQFIPAVVKTLNSSKHGYKKIMLSVNPEDVNLKLNSQSINPNMALWGFVSSVEDHGCIVSFGIKNVTGFLESKEQGNLQLGYTQWFLVKQHKAGSRVLHLSADSDELKSTKVTDETHGMFNSLLPGALVKASVSKANAEGVVVRFNGFEGVIDQLHLRDHGIDVENKLKEKKKVKCRITYIDPSTKLIGLSAIQEIVDLNSDIIVDEFIGSIEDCTVIRGDSNFGLLVELQDSKRGFVHISRLSDKKIEKLGKKYKAGTVHQCRIIGYNGIDRLFTVTFQKSVIEQPFLRYIDIKPGIAITGTIITLEDFGMLVKVSDHIKGLCPRVHLADINLKYPEKKLTDGKKVKCRVLRINAEKKRLTLTHKKTMVNSELPIITNYDEIRRGMQIHGYIDSIRDYGLIIRFYNNVKGLAAKNQLGLQTDEKLQDVFFIGQVVKCTVLSCNPNEKKLKLTLKAASDVSKNEDDESLPLSRGAIVSADVLKITSSGLDVRLPNGKTAFLPKEHLSDFKCNQEPQLFLYEVDKENLKSITDVVYLGERRKRLIVSNKQLFRFVAEKAKSINSFEQMKVGTQAVGFVHQIMPYGIFIEFAPGVVGLAPNSNLADYFVTDPSSCFELGQTLFAKVVEVDEERKRLLVTVKPSDTDSQNSDIFAERLNGERILHSLLEERQNILQKLSSIPDGPVKLLSSVIGKNVQGKIMSVRSEGVRLQAEDGANGFIPNSLRRGIDMETGDIVSCFVIDVDMDNWLFIAKPVPEDSDKTTKAKKIKDGQEVDAVIEYITSYYIVASLPKYGPNIMAYLVAKEHLNDIRDVTKRFFIGQKVTAHVSSVTSSGIILVCRDSFENGEPTVGAIVTAVVKSVKASQVNISITNTRLHGRIHISEIWDEPKEGMCPFDEFKPGESIRCRLIGFRDAKTQKYLPITHQQSSRTLADLSLKPSQLNTAGSSDVTKPKDVRDFEKGESVTCFIKAVSENFLTVFVNQKVNGRVSILNTSTDRKVLRHFTSHFKHGAAYKATVLAVDQEHDCLELSFIGDPTKYIKKDSIISGRITKILPRTGLLIELPGHKCGVAHITQLHDEYKEHPLEEFKPKTFVKCCILAVRDQDQIDLSLRPSRAPHDDHEAVEVKDRAILSLDDLHEKDILRGYVKSCTSCGVFVWLSPKIVGRTQIKNLSKYFVKNWQELFPVGKLVKAKILSIDPNTNNIDLSFRGPDVNDKDPAPPPKRRKESDSNQPPKKSKKMNEDSESKDVVDSDDDVLHTLNDDAADSDSESDEEEEDSPSIQGKKSPPRLTLSSGFDWSDTMNEEQNKRKYEESDSESEEETEQTSLKKSKRQKRAAKKAEEEYLHKTELALLDKDRGPENAEDFDRLILSSPNSSLLWIQYMAFYLHSAEIDKARSVAERALKTISFREEQDKFNVWIALLNLETLYGTDETAQNVFNEAVRQTDAKKLYLRMVDICIKNNKFEKATKLYQTMIRRFNTSKKVWVSYGFFLMKTGEVDAARKLLPRSFQSLPDRKHINTILKFAIMEFRFGDSQKGITMFESVLKNSPKRTDIWSVYLDMMIKQGETAQVRNIFERIITLNLSTKKMKFIFKRYLDFERKYGDSKLMDQVKTKALDYVESKVAIS